MTRTRAGSDSGSAAVEFALIVPLLLLIVLGIAEFGRAYNIQLALSAAAREGVRVMAIENNPGAARTATKAAAPAVAPAITDAQITISPATCVAGASTRLTVTYQLEFLTDLIGDGPMLTGVGVMRCNG